MRTKLALAPMAGVTDRAFREICLEWGADITWSEMVSAEGIVRHTIKNNKSLLLAKSSPRERTGEFWVQIFGNNPTSMAQAATLVAKEIKPFGIDINLGCPVPKAVRAGYGVVQLKDITQTIKIIKAVRSAVKLPLSIKTRLGLRSPEEILTFAPLLEKAGINQLAVHARTHKEMFHGEPHWEVVKKLQRKMKIPVIYNGGINSPEKALFYQENTGCETLMIGQAAIGRPWLFKQIKYFLETGQEFNPTEKEIKETVLKHAELTYKFFGAHGLVIFRRHLMAYLKGATNASLLRSEATSVKSLQDIKSIIKKARWEINNALT